MAETSTKTQLRPNRIILVLVVILGLLGVVFALAWVWLQSGSGRTFVEQQIESREFSGQSVTLEGIEGSVLGELSIDRLVLTDQEGDWLIAEDVRLDWYPSALLRRALSVKVLEARKINLLARPILTASEGGGDAPIRALDIQGVRFPDIDVAEQVAGRPVSLSMSGALQQGGEGGQSTFTARSDQGDRVDADLEWSRLLVLSGTADIVGSSGGLLAQLLRLEAGQSIQADVSTQDSQTEVQINIDAAEFADLTIERGQSTATVSGQIDPGKLPVLASFAPLLGGVTTLNTILPLDNGSQAQIMLNAPKLQVTAAGQREQDGVVFDQVELSATNPLDGIGPESVRVASLEFSGSARWMDAYQMSGTLQAEQVSYGTYLADRLAGPVTLSFAENSLAFDAQLDGRATQGLMANANGANVALTGDYDIETRNLSLSRANINLPGLTLTGSGSVETGGDQSNLKYGGRYDINTSVFRDGPAARLRGQADMTTEQGVTRIALTGQASRWSDFPTSLEPVLKDGLNYRAQLRLRDGRLVVPSLAASNSVLDLTGNASFSNGALTSDLTYSVNRYEYERVSATDISGEAVLSGPVSNLDIQTQLTAEKFLAAGLELQDTDLALTGQYGDSLFTGSAELSGQSEQGPVIAQSDVRWMNGQWGLDNLVADLGALNSTGAVSGLGGDIASIRADLTLSGSTPLIPAETIEGRVLLQDSQVDVDTTLTGLTVSVLRDATLNLVAKGPRDSVSFDASLQGEARIREIDRPLSVSAQGSADLRPETLSVRSDYDVSLNDLGLIGTLTAARDDGLWSGEAQAEGLGGNMEIRLAHGPQRTLSFDVTRLSVARLARLVARPVAEGSLSGRGEFVQIEDRIEGSATLSIDDLRSPDSDSQAISIQGDLSLQNEQLTMTLAALDGGLNGAASIEGPVETLPDFPFLSYPFQTPLEGRADLRGEVGPLVEVFLSPQTDFSGRINTDVAFSVPYDPQTLQGRVTLFRGTLEQGDIGLNLRDIVVEAQLSGDTISVPTLSARDQDEGLLTGSGEMRLNDASASVKLRAERLNVIKRREGQAEMSGDLELTRTSDVLRLSGDLTVTDADINIARLPEAGLPTLDIRFEDDEEEDQNAQSFSSTATEMDIRVRSNGRIDVTGRGLDAALNLDARIVGAFDNPDVSGEMSVERGRFNFLGKRFEFRDSSILLRDEVMQSVLSLEAVRSTPDLTAVARVSGTFERPEIELTSEPNLPEDEVLSRILFGRSPTQLTAIETARLAGALAQLSGGGGLDLFGSLENAIGLDTLDVGQTDTGQAQLTTGKYLSDDVYLEVRTAAEGTPSVAVEWQVRDNISLEAETVPNESERLSIQWKKDFD